MRLAFDKIRNWQIWLFLLLLTFLVYGSSLRVGFLSDDWHWLALAKDINWSPNILITNYEGGSIGGSYNPLTFVVFKLAYLFFGLHDWAYHFLSLLIFSINSFLLYLLARKILLLAKINYSKTWSLAIAVLFLVWPTQTEVVNWLAAWPHLLGATGYLLTFIFYFKWRREKNNIFFWWSMFSFILALGLKELAMSLPFIVLLWEMFFYSLDKKNKISWKIIFYFLFLVGFFLLRFQATKAFLGYYGVQKLGWSWQEWVGNLGAFLNDLFSFSFLREIYYKVWYRDLASLVIIILVSLAIYFWYTYWAKKWLQFVLASSVLACLLPMIPLGMQRLSFADERYLYLASGFFIIWLAVIISEMTKDNKKYQIIFICLIIINLPIVFYKNYIWLQAGRISQGLIASYSSLVVDDSLPLVSVGLPDNLNGAQVFRNNLQQALELTYPEYHQQIINLPIYTLPNVHKYSQQLLKWRKDELGWFAESVDGSFIITGKTSLTDRGIYWELWNYNYQNFTANIIRLMPVEQRAIQWLTWEQGKLKIVN